MQSQLAATLRAVTKLGGNVELVEAGALPTNGKGDRGRALANQVARPGGNYRAKSRNQSGRARR